MCAGSRWAAAFPQKDRNKGAGIVMNQGVCSGVHGLMHLRISHDPPLAFLALNYIGVILRWI
jgi:hypothetical protein